MKRESYTTQAFDALKAQKVRLGQTITFLDVLAGAPSYMTYDKEERNRLNAGMHNLERFGLTENLHTKDGRYMQYMVAHPFVKENRPEHAGSKLGVTRERKGRSKAKSAKTKEQRIAESLTRIGKELIEIAALVEQ